MLGQGASGRPRYDAFSHESAIDFHLDSINAWVDRKLLDEKFYLLGHSLGSCIAGHFALRYPHKIEKLILMSPVGLKETPEHMKYEAERAKLTTWVQRYGQTQAFNLWDNGRIAPFDLARAFPFVMNKMVRDSIERRFNLNDPILTIKVANYIEQLLLRKKSSEVGITSIFAFRVFGRKPLAQQFAKLQFPVLFLMGEYDWVERKTSDEWIEKGYVKGEVQSVQNSGHHLYIEGAYECSVDIVSFCFGEEEANIMISRNQ
jgi:cardiolipin-specific phospholipase